MAAALSRLATAQGSGRGDWPAIRAALLRLQALREVAVPADLLAWGLSLETAGAAAVPLLGLGVRASTYPGLFWNGARLERAGAGDIDSLVLVGLVASAHEATAADLTRAAAAGLAVSRALTEVRGRRPTVATPSTRVAGAAVCAALVSGRPVGDLADLLDIAGTLMVVGPEQEPVEFVAGEADSAVGRSLRSGHELAAGWFTAVLFDVGIVGVPGGLADTLTTVTGHRVDLPMQDILDLGSPAASAEPDPPAVRVADLLAGLT